MMRNEWMPLRPIYSGGSQKQFFHVYNFDICHDSNWQSGTSTANLLRRFPTAVTKTDGRTPGCCRQIHCGVTSHKSHRKLQIVAQTRQAWHCLDYWPVLGCLRLEPPPPPPVQRTGPNKQVKDKSIWFPSYHQAVARIKMALSLLEPALQCSWCCVPNMRLASHII